MREFVVTALVSIGLLALLFVAIVLLIVGALAAAAGQPWAVVGCWGGSLILLGLFCAAAIEAFSR